MRRGGNDRVWLSVHTPSKLENKKGMVLFLCFLSFMIYVSNVSRFVTWLLVLGLVHFMLMYCLNKLVVIY